MRYMLLLYSAEDAGPQPETEEFGAEMEKWFAYTNEITEAGHMLGGEALQGSETATTVQVRDGKALTTDGPFAETKEVLGGFYMIDVPDLDAAREWAAKIPSAPYGSVEIRPIMEIPTDG
ncbi:MAG: YciI family protein [Actinomycetota bacterium]